MVQMDFAEDYKCHSQNEMESAYWNATQVTLHPTVVHVLQRRKHSEA